MADVEEQVPAEESVAVDNGAADGVAAPEQPVADTVENGDQGNGTVAADPDFENSNKRKLDEEAEEEEGPVKKKPVLSDEAADGVDSAPGSANAVDIADPPGESDPAAQAPESTPAAQQNGAPSSDPKPNEEAISCPRNMVGKLIGREGSTIKDLQSRSGAKIQIDHASEGPNKTVTLIGTPDAINMAKDLIKQTLESDSTSATDAQKSVDCPPGIVGRIIGRGGETIKALQSASNAHIVVDQNFPEGQPRKIHISGKPEFVEKAVKMITDVISGEPGSWELQTIIQKYGETRVIDCPKSVVGRIIGKGGETIKGLQKESGASIQIDQSTDPSKIQVAGKRQAVEHALHRLRALINDEPYPGGGHFPPGGGYGASMRPPFGGPGFNAPYPVAPGGYGGFGGYPQAGGGAAPYGYGYGAYPQYGTPQYGGYGSYGSGATPTAAASDPYASSYGSQAGGYQQSGGYSTGVAAPAASGGSLWREERDSEGRPYYYNTKTGVSQWEKPAEMA